VFSHKGENWQFPPNGGLAGHPAYAKFGKGQDADGIVREIGIAPRCFQDPHPSITAALPPRAERSTSGRRGWQADCGLRQSRLLRAAQPLIASAAKSAAK